MASEDTIAAIITAYGHSSVGAVRISGTAAARIADSIFQAGSKELLCRRPTHTVTYGWVVDGKDNKLDEALALTMWAPRSFTGEDVVELQCHGGTIVLRRVLEMALEAGARMAEPGEFSKRAFLNGKMDLSQAEAIVDIIYAKTEAGVRAAANNLQGNVARSVNEIREKMMEIIAYLEAEIDFPEEDFDRMTAAELEQGIEQVGTAIDRILETYRSGRIMREGLKTVLAGRPNVGKSTLLNALLGEKRAIVTDVPGTTRDLIEEYYNLGGIPLVLTDTAGIRAPEDLVEKLGLEKTQEAIEQADLILYIVDISAQLSAEDLEYIKKLPQGKLLVVINKVDLLEGDDGDGQVADKLEGYRVAFVSAKEGTGLKELGEEIAAIFFSEGLEISEQPFLSNTRHKDALNKARQAVSAAGESIGRQVPADLISIDLRQAWLSLGEVTGDTLGDDIIDQIFSRFCLGK